VNVRSLYGAGSLRAVVEEISKYKLDLMGVQEVRWDRDGTEPAGAKVDREDIFKPTVGNESLLEISDNNGVGVVNFATSKNLIVRSTMFAHSNIHKFTWTSLEFAK
jgi:hypothetical protein